MFTLPDIRQLVTGALLLLIFGLIGWTQLDSARDPDRWQGEVIATYPHDPSAFTQGLTINQGKLYESTGPYGNSSLRRVHLESGRIEKILELGENYFGEGITIFGKKLYQLTWRSRIGFVYDLETFDVVNTFGFSGEGWGLTNDNQHLIVSDGSSSVRFLDPETFNVIKRINVKENNLPVTQLNELEYINGEIWANIWHEDRIARISPRTGEILGWVDLSDLYPRSSRGNENVMNGIAFDQKTQNLFITGKNWPSLFEIKVTQL